MRPVGLRSVAIALALAVGAMATGAFLVVAPAGAAEGDPPGGPVSVGTYGVTSSGPGSLVCTSIYSGPDGAEVPSFGAGSYALTSCYGPPQAAGTVTTIRDLTIGSGDSFGPNAFDGTHRPCSSTANNAPSEGRFQFACSVTAGTVHEVPSYAWPYGTSIGECGVTLRNATTGVSYATAGAATVDGSTWQDGCRWTELTPLSYPFPAWWPSSAQPDPSHVTAHLPNVSCSGIWDESRTKLTLRAVVNDPPVDGAWQVDSPGEWALGWNGTGAGGEPSQPGWWLDHAPLLDGPNQVVATVPAAGMPVGGWPVVFRMRRTITESSSDDSDQGVGGFDGISHWEGATGGVWDWIVGHDGGYSIEDPTDTSFPTSWTTAEARCTVKVKPGIDTTGHTSPYEDGPTSVDPVDPQAPAGPCVGPFGWTTPGCAGGGGGGGGGGDGGGDGAECVAPSGWSQANPVAWLSFGACQTGGLLSKLLDLIRSLISAVAHILDGLLALFVPSDNTFGDAAQQVSEAWDDSGGHDVGTPFIAMGGGLGALTDAAASTSGGDCKGPTFNFPIPTKAPVEIAPLNACNPTGANLANWCRVLSSFAIMLLACGAAAKIAAAAFGLQLSFGGGGGSGDS